MFLRGMFRISLNGSTLTCCGPSHQIASRLFLSGGKFEIRPYMPCLPRFSRRLELITYTQTRQVIRYIAGVGSYDDSRYYISTNESEGGKGKEEKERGDGVSLVNET